jgi:hypothetical protein
LSANHGQHRYSFRQTKQRHGKCVYRACSVLPFQWIMMFIAMLLGGSKCLSEEFLNHMNHL